MKLNPIIATVIVGAIFALQGWTLATVVDLKVSMARMEERQNAQERTAASTPLAATYPKTGLLERDTKATQ